MVMKIKKVWPNPDINERQNINSSRSKRRAMNSIASIQSANITRGSLRRTVGYTST